MPANLRLTAWLLIASVALAATALGADGRILPFRLMVLNYDADLDAVLVSGEFQNDLDAELRAFQGVLELTPEGSAPISLRFDCGVRRIVPPAQYGVCSHWIEGTAGDPLHEALKATAGARPPAVLRVTAVLYADGREQSF